MDAFIKGGGWVEIEAKFAITGELDTSALMTVALSPYTLAAEDDIEQHDTIYDTATRAISRSLHGLRLRQIGPRTIVTLKGPATVVDGVHERMELEADLPPGDGLRRRSWPPEIRDRVRLLAGRERLSPVLELTVHRRTFLARNADGQVVAELALDRGTIHAVGTTEPIHELEIELKDDGTRADLAALTERLTAVLPLTPESRSKLQRGMALLDGSRQPGGRAPLHEVAGAAMSAHLAKLRESEPVARDGADPEGVHQMRVATRRLRTTLQILEAAPTFDADELKALRRKLGRLADALGEVRDPDVMIGHLTAYLEAHPEIDLEPLMSHLTSRREHGREALLKALDKPAFGKWMEQLEALVSRPVSAADARWWVRHFAGSAVWSRYEAVLHHESLLADPAPAVLHELRIACKRLRYVLELFEGPLAGDVGALLKTLKAVQEHLGEIQDHATALGLIAELRATHPDSPGLDTYAAHRTLDRDRLMAEFAPVWTALSGLPYRARLADLIARL